MTRAREALLASIEAAAIEKPMDIRKVTIGQMTPQSRLEAQKLRPKTVDMRSVPRIE